MPAEAASKMYTLVNCYNMNIEDVKIAARKYVQGIAAIHPMLDVPRIILCEEARNTSLTSLIETLGISASEKHISQVGY